MKPSRKLLSSVIFFSMSSFLAQAASDITISNQVNSDITGSSPFRDATDNGGTSNLQVVTLVGALGTSNVVVTTNTTSGTGPFGGRIEVKDSITWNAVNSLSLNADSNIIVGATINSIGGGSLDLNAGGTVSFDADITMIGAAAGLSVTSSGVTQTIPRKLVVEGQADIDGGSGDVTLLSANRFGSLSLGGAAVTVNEADATLLTGVDSSSLTLNSAGSISDAVNTTISVTGLAHLNAGANAIILGDSPGDTTNFGSLNLTGSNVSITEDSSSELAGVSATTFTLNSNGAQTDTGNINVTGLATFNAGSHNITLGDNPAEITHFGTLNFTGGAVSINEDSSMDLVGSNTAGSAVLASTGALSDAAAASVSVTGLGSFSGNSISLGGGTFNTGSITFNSNGAVNIAEDSDMDIVGVNTGGATNLSSTGGISDAGATSVNVGALTIAGTSISLGGGIFNAATLNFNSTGAVNIAEDSSMDLVGSNTAGSASLSSTGALSDAGATNVAITGLGSFSGASISLGGGMFNTGSLNFNSTGAVNIQEDSATVLTGANTGSSLLLNSSGAVTDLAGTSLSITTGATINAGGLTSIVLDDTEFDVGGNTFLTAGAGQDIIVNNVANRFDGTVTFIASTGTLANVDVFDTTAFDLQALTVTNSLTAISGGALTDSGNLSVNGLATFGGSTITIGGASELTNFGSLTFNSTGAVNIQEDSSTLLTGTSTGLGLSLTSVAGITNDGTANLSVTNNANFSGTSITLGTTAGDSMNFGSLTFNSTGAVTIEEDSSTQLTGASTGQNLTLTSSAGITNGGTANLTVANNASLSGSSITLGTIAGDSMNFGSLTFNSTGAVTIEEDSSSLLTGTSTGQSLDLSSAGDITNTGTANLTVTDNASFDGTSITLGTTAGDSMNFGSLTFNSTGAVVIEEDSSTLLTGNSTGQSLDLSSVGEITNTGTSNLTVTDNASFDGTSITLGTTAGDSMNFGSLTFNSTGAVTIEEDSSTLLTGISTGQSLDLASVAGITNTGTADLTITDNASFDGTSITLGNVAGDSMNFGSLTFNSTGVVTIEEDSSTLLTGTSTGQSLDLSSFAGITNTATANLSVNDNASFEGTSITLGNVAGDSMNFGSLTFNSTGAVAIEEDSSTLLTGTSTGQSLDLGSVGDIANTGTANLTVTDNASFDGTSITLGTTAGDVMNFGSLTFNSTGAVTIEEDSSTLLTGSSTGQSLDLSSVGDIANTGTANLTVTDNASFDGTSITLGATAGDSMNFGSLTFNSAGAVTIEEDSSTLLTGTSTGQSLDLASLAAISNTAAANLTVTDNASFDGTSITLGTTAGDSMNFGSLTFNSTGAVTIEEDSSTLLTGTSTGQSLDLTSLAAITNTATSNLTVTDNASFDGTSITLGTTAGDLMNFGSLTFNSAGAVTIEEDSSTLLTGTSTGQSLDLTSLAAITNTATANLTVTDNASFDGTSITLGNVAGDLMNFGSLTFNSAGAVTIEEDSSTLLTGASTGQSLDLSSFGDIANTATANLTVTDNASFDGTSITLGTTAGDVMNFGSLTFNTSGAVIIEEDSSTLLTGTSTGQSLDLTSLAAITNTVTADVTVTDNASFDGTSITLGTTAGDSMNFGSLTFNSTGAVTIEEDSSTLLTGTSTGQSLDLSSVGDITNTATSNLTVTDNASFDGASITLGTTAGDSMNFGSLTFNSTGAVTIEEDSSTLLTGISTGQSLDLTSLAAITNTSTADVTITGNASFDGTSITLGTIAGDIMNFGSLTFNSGGAVVVEEDSSTLLTGTNTGQSLELTSVADIGNTAAASLTVADNASFDGTSITLGTTAGDSMNFGSLTFNSTGAVTIEEDSSTLLTGISTGQSLDLSSEGDIANTGTADLTVTDNASFDGTSITLGATAGDSMNFGSLTFNSSGAVAIEEDSSTLLTGISTGQSLDLTSLAAITNTGTANLTVTDNASFDGTSITLGTTAGDSMNFGSLTFNSTGAVTIEEDSSTLLTGTSTGQSLDLTSLAAIANTATSNLTVTDNASFDGTSITLGTTAGDSMNFGSLTFNSTGAVSIEEDSSTLLTGTSTGQSLDLTSLAAIANTGTANLTVTDNASFGGTSITLGTTAGDSMNFGSLTFNSTGSVAIEEDSSTLLTGTSTGQSLDLGSVGDITNTGAANLTVTDNASFDGTSITLGATAGDSMNFGSLTFNSVGVVTIEEDSSTLLTGISTGQSLDLTSLAAISNTATGNLTVTDNASFTGTSIMLGNVLGDSMNFGSLTFNSAGAVIIEEDSSTLITGTSTGQSLDLTSLAAISNTATANLTVADNASFDGTSITLGTTAGDAMNFGSLAFNSAGAVTIEEDSSTLLTGTSTGQSLDLASVAGITNTGIADLTITDNASFDGTSIALGTTAGDSMNFGSLTFNSTGVVTIEEDSSTLLTGISTGQSLDLTSLAAISNTATANLTVTDNASFEGTSITLGTTAGDAMNFGSLTFNSVGAVTIEEDSSTLLAGASTGQSLDLKSVGGVTNTSTANLTVIDNASFDGTSITLGTTAGDAMNFGSLTFNSTGAVTIREDSSTLLTGINTGQSLDLTSLAAISNTATANLAVIDNASFEGTSITLGTTAGDSMNFGSLTFSSVGTVTISEDSDMELVGVNTGGTTTLVSIGAISDSGATRLTTGALAVSGSSISLGGGIFDATTLNFNSSGSVSISEDSSMSIVGVNTAGSASLSSVAALSDAGATSIDIAGLGSFTGTSIGLGAGIFNTGSLTFNSDGEVNITEDSSTLLTGTSTGDVLALASAGAIANDTFTHLTVVNHAGFDGTSITLGSVGSDSMNFGTLSFNATGAVTIQEDSSTHLTGTSTAGSLDLASAGALTDGGDLAVVGLATLSGSSVMIGGHGQTTHFGSLNVNSPGLVEIQEDSDTSFVGRNSANILRLTSSGVSTFTTGATLDAVTLDIITETAALTGNNLFDMMEVRLSTGTTLTLSGSDTIATLDSNGGTIAGTAILTATDGAVLNGGVVSGHLRGDTTATGTVLVSGSVGDGFLQVGGGTFTLTGTSGNDLVEILAGASLVDSSGGLSAAADVTNAGRLTVGSNDRVRTYTQNGSGALVGSSLLTTSHGAILNGGSVSGNLRGKTTSNGQVLVTGSLGGGSLLIEAGTLTLVGSSSNGRVTVSDGAVLVDARGGLSAAAAVGNSGRIVVNADDTVATYTQKRDGVLAGRASLTATGGAILYGGTVHGNLLGNTESAGDVGITGTVGGGGLLVSSGTLTLTGTAKADTHVKEGATLRGDGFIDGNLLNRGTTALSLTISGSLVTTGTVTMSFNNSADFDRIKAGSADLGGGLIVTNTGTGLASGEITQIIDAGAYSNSFTTFEAFNFDNGVLFNNQTGMLVGLGGGRAHAGGTYLNLNRNQTNTYLALFEDSVQTGTRNVFRNGDAIDFVSGATNGDPDLVNALYQASFTTTGGIDMDTVNSLSPEVYAGMVDYTKQALRAHSRAAMETAPVARNGRTEVFATAHTHTAGVDNSTTNSGYDTDMNGATAGMRYDVDGNIHVGGFIGVDDGTISGNLIDADAQGYVIGTFANYQFEDSRRTSVFGSMSYGDYSHDTIRRSFGGESSADGIASDAFELLIGTSTVLYEKEGFLISPSAAFRFMSGEVDGFTESGAGVPLTVDSQDIDSLLLDLAVDFTYDVTDRFSVAGRVGYAHELSETDHTVSSTFAATGAGGQGFQVTAPGMDDQAIILGAGLFYDVSDAARIGATYRGEFGSDSQATQSIGLGATFAF